jgi:hypothetical protein
MNETNNARPHHTKPRFYDLCLMCQLDYETLQVIADQAKVPLPAIDALFEGHPVERSVAQKVLAVLSQRTAQPFTLDKVDIPLILPDTQAKREDVEGEHG